MMPEFAVDDSILTRRTAQLIRENFSHETVSNLLVVRFGKKWRTKLGHIKPMRKDAEFGSLIEINPLLVRPGVPEFVLDATLLHELIHYFDGFGSNKQRKYRHPHKGGVVDREMALRGFGEILKKQKKWLDENWQSLCAENRV